MAFNWIHEITAQNSMIKAEFWWKKTLKFPWEASRIAIRQCPFFLPTFHSAEKKPFKFSDRLFFPCGFNQKKKCTNGKIFPTNLHNRLPLELAHFIAERLQALQRLLILLDPCRGLVQHVPHRFRFYHSLKQFHQQGQPFLWRNHKERKNPGETLIAVPKGIPHSTSGQSGLTIGQGKDGFRKNLPV